MSQGNIVKTKPKNMPDSITGQQLVKWRELLMASAEHIEALNAKIATQERQRDTFVEKELLLLEKLIAAEERIKELNAVLLELADPDNCLVVAEPVHLNPADQLPPVDCPLLIQVDGELLQAERASFIASRDRAMVYRLNDGRELEGRFPWTYP